MIATGPNSSIRLTYTILGEATNTELVIHSRTGFVSSEMKLDRDSLAAYFFLIHATDERGFRADTT